MTKKRFILLASLPLTIVMTLGVLAMLPPSPGVTKANFDCIQDGMTKAQVEEILGREGTVWAEQWMYWGDDDKSWTTIEFLDDCVIEKLWFGPNETILDKIRRWFHLQ